MTESPALARLDAGRTSTRAGKYEEALREFVWFHEHALAEEPSLRAVRLSFALSDWMNLAEVYPRALLVLEEIRDRKTAVLRVSAGGSELFHDVASINERLECEEKTHALFTELVRLYPTLAKRCAAYALRSVIKVGDFQLAYRFLPAPESEVRFWSAYLNRQIRRRRQSSYTPAPRIKADIDIYATKIKQIMAVLDGCGQKAEAARIKSLACALIQATTIREAVRAALAPNARPWYERGTPRARVGPRPAKPAAIAGAPDGDPTRLTAAC
jgi:hypothetical protein